MCYTVKEMNIVHEKKIAGQCERLVTKHYAPAPAERFKKRVELFHLLMCFQKMGRKYRKIEPHDPGDFIMRDEQGTHLFEVVTIFGNKDAYRQIEAQFQLLFLHGQGYGERIRLITSFEENADELKKLLVTKMWEKNEKEYFKTGRYKTANLLLVTAEHDRKKRQFPWFLSLARKDLEQVMAQRNFTTCYVLDYLTANAMVFDLEKILPVKRATKQ